MCCVLAAVAVVVLSLGFRAAAEEAAGQPSASPPDAKQLPPADVKGSPLSFLTFDCQGGGAQQPPPADGKGPPLPFITIEGQGGGAITPMAYLVNPAPEGQIFGKPSVAFDQIGLDRKNLNTFMITENLFGRIELGFAADALGLGTLPGAIEQNTGVEIGRSDVWLYNFSLRGLLVKENAGENNWIPAVTVGAIFKTNDGIHQINESLGGVLRTIGYARENGTDFTLTATKKLPEAFFGKPLILTAGLRESEAADLGFLGFSRSYKASFEGSIAILPFEKWLFAYEFRQKDSPYSTITLNNETIIGREDNWHAFDVAYIINNHATFVAGYGIFGNLANAKANNAWWIQLKYEF
jgi:hypothetical protein